MNEKQLLKANILASKIQGLKNQVDIWKNAERLMLLALRTAVSGEVKTMEIDPYLIDFERLRQEILRTLEQRLSKLKAEFASL